MPEADHDLRASDLAADLQLLETAARQAGELALGYFGQGLETWFKGNKSPVSEADIAVDRFLASKKAAASKGLGVRMTKIVPPGTT